MRKVVLTLAVVALAASGSTACATKKYVQGRVGEVNDRVETLSQSLEETQERTRQNEGRIAQVDERVSEVDQKAVNAGQAAQQAHSAARAANDRAEAVDRATKRLVYEVVLSEEQGNFKFAQTALPDEARSQLDRLVEQLKAEPNGAYIEIEGHTDSTGAKEINERIGLERAEAVKRYLYEQHQIPLHKINVISYGEEKPVAPNQTREGRAQNRRVVVKVLA
jgi:outer membrane protein OmpA-like peptidoglycan-associated protein